MPLQKMISAAGLAVLTVSIACAAPYTGAGPGQSTIGTGGDYPTLYAATQAISAAPLTGGDWEFLILNDLTEPQNSSITQAASTSHTITIRPALGTAPTVNFATTQTQSSIRTNGHLTIGAYLTPAPGSSIVRVPTHHITIDGSNTPGSSSRDLTFVNTAGTGARALIGITGACENITIKNCNLHSNGTYHSGSWQLDAGGVEFKPDGSPQNRSAVLNCNLTYSANRPAAAISLNYIGGFLQPGVFSNRFTASDNKITSFSRAIEAYGCAATEISQNIIHFDARQSRNGSGPAGIFVQPAATNAVTSIAQNQITFTSSPSTLGISGIVTRELETQSQTIIDNNTVSGDFTCQGNAWPAPPERFGIVSETGNGSTVTLRHNSINFIGSTIQGERAAVSLSGNLYQNSYGKMVLRNNIVRAGVPGVAAIHTAGTSETLDSDYNDIFAVPGAYIGQIGYSFTINGASPDLTTWQTRSGQDVHSISTDPFQPAAEGYGTWTGPQNAESPSLLFTAYPGPTYLAPAIAAVPVDINNTPRTNSTAIIGAHEAFQGSAVTEWHLY